MMKSVVVSAVVAAVVGVLAAFLFMTATKKTDQPQSVYPPPEYEEATPEPISTPPPREPLIVAKNEVSSLSIKTVYRNFFPADDSKCRGNSDADDERYRSPCEVTIVFDRDGGALKKIVYKNPNAQPARRTIEETTWTGKTAPAEFESLAAAIVESDMFKNWNENVQMHASNCAISVTHPKGTRRMLSNVHKTATAYYPKVEAFMNLERRIVWKKTQNKITEAPPGS